MLYSTDKENNLKRNKIFLPENQIIKDKEEENKECSEYRIIKNDISNIEKLNKLIEKKIPNFFDHYEIKEVIGKGSESLVYKVIYKKTGKPYTMKIIFFEKGRNINEFNILNKLKNKNVILFYGVYEIQKNELDCIIMEFAKFGNLRDFKKNILKRDFLAEQLLCYFSFQILNGLRYCHMCKIAHFDLKPQNIVIDEYLNLKLIDFSVSLNYSKINSNTIKLPFRGTNFYMAPEVIKSKTIDLKDINKIDLYSLGVILYNLAFCSYPYDLNSEDCNNYDKIYKKITNNELNFNNEDNCYSKYFIDFLKQLLEKDINKRININQAIDNYWIKGAKILFDEKEKCFNASNFLINLMTDHFMSFDRYVNM